MLENKVTTDLTINRQLPTSADLKRRAKLKIPKFAYDYLIEGCLDDVGLNRNRQAVQEVTLEPQYLQPFSHADLSVELFGKCYDAPFGVAPVGLQGLMWPNSPIILAKAAKKHNVPYVLSTVSSESLEVIAETAEDNAWYQLYNPTDTDIRDDVLRRLKASGYQNLIVTVDVPTFGYRPRDYKNGLSMPPKTSIKNFIQAAICPEWGLKTLKYGVPSFKNLKSYMGDDFDMQELTDFMNTMAMGGISMESLKPIREMWQGKLIIKGVMSEADVIRSIALGADGVIISNHGARQLDACDASVTALGRLYKKYQDKITIMMDSGLRSGSDVACALASGAEFCFLGRFFMYGVAAMGDKGGQQTMAILKTQLAQTMSQVRCANVTDLPDFLSKKSF